MLYLFIYLVCYYSLVRKLHAVDGVWHWNLFFYYGYAQFTALTLLFFVLVNLVDRRKE